MSAPSSPLPYPGAFVALIIVVAVLVVGIALGVPVGLLLGAAVALTLVITLAWQSLQHLSGETELTFEEALSLAAPTAEEEQKRAVLRALKDLEYERSVGKIVEDDYRELSAFYRAEAKRLIQAVDVGLEEQRAHAERLLAERLKEESLEPQPAGAPVGEASEEVPSAETEGEVAEPTPVEASKEETAEERVASAPTETRAAPLICTACGTSNDADARFCKKCGTALDGGPDETPKPPEDS